MSAHFYCPNCGREGGSGLRYCRACGMDHKLASEALTGVLGPKAGEALFGADREAPDAVVRRYLGAKTVASMSARTKAAAVTFVYGMLLVFAGMSYRPLFELVGYWGLLPISVVPGIAFFIFKKMDEAAATRAEAAEEADDEEERAPTAPAFCPQCGTKTEAWQRFCRKCGTDVEAIGHALGGLLVPVALDDEVRLRARDRLTLAAAYGYVVLLHGWMLLAYAGDTWGGVLGWFLPGEALDAPASLALQALLLLSALYFGGRALADGLRWRKDPAAGLAALEAAGGVNVRRPVRALEAPPAAVRLEPEREAEPRPAMDRAAAATARELAFDPASPPPSVTEHTTFRLDHRAGGADEEG